MRETSTFASAFDKESLLKRSWEVWKEWRNRQVVQEPDGLYKKRLSGGYEANVNKNVIRVKEQKKLEYTMKSLILAQDER